MFSRLRASVVGGEGGAPPPQSSPPSSPRRRQPALSPAGQQQPQSPHSQPQRGAGLLSPLFFSNNNNNNNNNNVTSSPRHPSLPLTNHESLNQSQSFFGGLFTSSQSATSLPPTPSSRSSNTEASPRSIRASASALLKMATPPPFTSSSSGTTNNNNNSIPNFYAHGSSRTDTTNNTTEEEEDDDRDALEYQLQNRENYIAKLTSDLHKLQEYTLQYQRDIQTLRRQQLESSFRHRVSTKLWRRTNEGLASRCACYQKELTSEAAREIANLIRDAAPPNKDSTYLMMLQDQLNKATLKLSHLSSQTEIILSKGEEVIESLRTEMNEVIRERCKMELELLDSIKGLEEDMKRMVNRTERRLKRVQGEIDYLEKNAVEVLKKKEEEEDEDEDDEDKEEEEDDENGIDSEEDDIEIQAEGEVETEEGDGEKQSKNKEEEVDTKEAADGNPSSDMPNDDTVGMKDSQQHQQNEKEGENDEQQQQQQRKQEEHTPENLRNELRKLATDRDATLSILQKKLREKNEEFQTLLKSKKSREATIDKLESVKRDREEWERSREEGVAPTMI